MAISPTVQQYQMPEPSEMGVSDAETIFKKKFGESAYKVIQSKYPKLVPFVVTFKTIDSKVDDGYAIGSFIVKVGGDVLYMPVVMVGGNIESCEVLYNKVEDTLVPASEKEVANIVSTNQLGTFTLTNTKVPDNSAKVFRNMFRPPVSSRPVFASSSLLENLPDKAKETLSTYLLDHPETLAKIAEFYPIESLATKLAGKGTKETAKQTRGASVISLAEITKEASQTLTDKQKEDLVKVGYAISSTAGNTQVIPETDITHTTINQYNISLLGEHSHTSGGHDVDSTYRKAAPAATGCLFTVDTDGLVPVPCLFTEEMIFFKGNGATGKVVNCMSAEREYVVSGKRNYLTMEDLVKFGGTPATSLVSDTIPSDFKGSIYVWYKTKTGYACKQLGYSGDAKVQKINDEIGIYRSEPPQVTSSHGSDDHEQLANFTNVIDEGYFLSCYDLKIFPLKTSVVMLSKRKNEAFVYGLGQFFQMLKATGRFVKVANRHPGYAISDSRTTKQASFDTRADVAKYLVDTYDMSKEAVDTTITRGRVLLLEKQGSLFQYGQNSVPFGPGTQQAQQSAMSQLQKDPVIQGMIGQAAQPTAQPTIDSDIINQATSMQDEDIMDTGLIASLAGNKDIKLLMLDMLPSFVKTVSDLGKSILLYVINADELKENYGREEYATFLGSLRSIFTSMGNIVTDLKAYVNTH